VVVEVELLVVELELLDDEEEDELDDEEEDELDDEEVDPEAELELEGEVVVVELEELDDEVGIELVVVIVVGTVGTVSVGVVKLDVDERSAQMGVKVAATGSDSPVAAMI
jgi:hypothetical protein